MHTTSWSFRSLRRAWAPVASALLVAGFISAGTLAQSAIAASGSAAAPRLSIDPSAQQKPFSGRVYLVLMKSAGDEGTRGGGGGGEKVDEPREHMGDWFRPPYVFSKDVKDLAGGAEVEIDDSWLAYPSAWKDVPEGKYTAQAVVRRSLDDPNPGESADDLVSEPMNLTLPLDGAGLVLTAGKAPSVRSFRESDRVKLVEMVSPSLSAFHGREYTVHAGVLLPEGYKDDGSVSYPVVYSITGFGGDHKSISRMGGSIPADAASHVILVVPDPLCYRGHSVFADSANNGPWGQMLVSELIPEVEKRYHGAGAQQRYVTGVSSGGWGSLWLQVTYPEAFAGCWSHCPDPVDFRDFQQIDLYKPGSNMYRDEQGQKRPLARRGGQVSLWYEDFCKREWALGPGGQIHSFEAVFSPRLPDGTPALVFDRQTGEVNTAVAHEWEKYDIRLILERNWSTLGPKLAGKLHIYAGGVDTFYLEGAVKLLKQSLADLHSDAVVEIIEGMPHSLYRAGNAEMYKTILKRAGVEPAPDAATSSGESR